LKFAAIADGSCDMMQFLLFLSLRKGSMSALSLSSKELHSLIVSHTLLNAIIKHVAGIVGYKEN